jgi:hypothetical protein
MIGSFDGVEHYKGLGTGFRQWALLFLESVEMAELACGYPWIERVKVNKLQQHLAGKPLRFFQANIEQWWAREATLSYALDQLWMAYKVNITHHQAVQLYGTRKESSRSWTEHFLYLTALMHASDTGPKLVLESVLKYAAPHLKFALLSRFNPARTDYLNHAQELVVWAQELEDDDKTGKTFGKDVVAAVVEKREQRTCYECGKRGHIVKDCKSKKPKKGDTSNGPTTWALAASDASAREYDWIVDSGASRHLVGDISMLENSTSCSSGDGLTLPNGDQLAVTAKGSVTLIGEVDGTAFELRLTDVYFAPALARNLISLGALARRGCKLESRGDEYAVLKSGKVVFTAYLDGNVLVSALRFKSAASLAIANVVMAAIEQDVGETDVQEGTLLDFHRRFGHLAFDTIKRMAQDPRSGIRITDRRRANCLTCAEGKASKSRQPQSDSGKNSPIDRVGGVICSDLKGPITPRDRHGNRYLINFIAHYSSYVRVFAAPTDMHRTIMNMVRCMIFGSGVALTYWSDAAEYAANVLNRSPTRSNPKRASPLEVLTSLAPSLMDIVVFGSPCMVFRDPRKQNLQKHAVRGYVIGKSDETKGYKVLLAKERKVITTRHVTAIETLGDSANAQLQRVLNSESETELEELAEARANARQIVEQQELVAPAHREKRASTRPEQHTQRAPRRSSRSKKKSLKRAEADGDSQQPGPARARELVAMAVLDTNSTTNANAHVEYGPDPKSFREARQSSESENWSKAEAEEIRSLEANETWQVVKCTPGTVLATPTQSLSALLEDMLRRIA